MKFFVTILLGMLCLAVAGLTFLLVAGPSDLLRDQLLQAVRESTGREIAVSGSASFTFYPRAGIALTDLTISQPEGMGDEPFVRVARVEVLTPLLALLRRELSVDDIVLNGAIVDLREDAAGRRNWDMPFAGTAKKRASLPDPNARIMPFRIASAQAGLSLLGSAHAAAPADPIPLGALQIANGTLRYVNERTGARQQVTAIDLRTKVAQPTGLVTIDGHGSWRGQAVSVIANVGSLRGLMAATSPIAIKLAAASGEAQFEGTAGFVPKVQLSGRLKSGTASLRALSEALGAPLPAGPGLGPLSLAGNIVAAADGVSIREMVASVDGVTAKGDVNMAGEPVSGRPLISGNLAIDRLDLNTYLGLASRGPGRAAAGAPTEKSIDDLLAQGGATQPTPGTKEEGTATVPSAGNRPAAGAGEPRVKGWSSVALDVSSLHIADLDLKLDLGRLIYKDIALDRTRMAASLHGGALKTVFHDAAMYKGRATGTLDLDATGEQPRIALQTTIEGVDVQPLLQAVAGFDRLAGRGTVVVKVTGHGATQQQITGSLAGTAAVNIANGAVVGFDLMSVLRAARQGQAAHAAPTDKTDFNEFSGTFAISGGVAQSQDLKLSSPAARVSGGGTIDLGKQLLDLTLKPKLTAQAVQGGAQGQIVQALSGIDIPVHVRGPWDAPRASIDVNAVAKDPEKIKKGVEQLGEILKSKEGKEAAKELGNAVRNLLKR